MVPAPPRAPTGDRRRRRSPSGPFPPDILYHATSVRRAERAKAKGLLEVWGGRPVFLSRLEGQAWAVAHRQSNGKQADEPIVLYIDVSRARRAGVRFERNGKGLWQARTIPAEHVLNLREGFGEQLSAGGIPVWMGPEGPMLALVRVRRRHGSTWEVAKGKLELAEPPADAALREIREEMGYPLKMEITHDLGFVRYGFFTPDGSPRLKTMFMYLMSTPERVETWAPREPEGIVEVNWFTPRQAVRLVPHRSLRPLMRRVRRILDPTGR